MKKRLKKKIYTDKTFEMDKETMFKLMSCSRRRKIKRALIQEGVIRISRLTLDVPYKDLLKIAKSFE